MMRNAALCLAAIAPLALGGCVVAALPLAAGAMVAKTQFERGPVARPRAAIYPAAETSTARLERLSLTELPPPDITRFKQAPELDAFRRYALAAANPTATGARASALLADGATLSAVRQTCRDQRSAVFIDLDPGRGTFDPLDAGTPNPALGPALAALRERGVAVIWFSRLGDNFSQPLRAALAQSGLDQDMSDRIVLMRNLDERKYTRSKDLAAEFCPIAILGDERADFDELYLYLKNPDGALSLEPMIGNGWFLASPFMPQPPIALGKEQP